MPIAAASGTLVIRSTTGPVKLGSTRWRPMPSIRDGVSVTRERSPADHAGKKAEFSGSATHSPVIRPV